MSEEQVLFGDEHVRRYRETDGEEGFDWREGSHILILTTTGRKSGREIDSPLIFGEDDGRYVVVASKGGAPQHPAWYLNLSAHPGVELQVKDEVFAARAKTADADERARLWPLLAGIWPAYDDYQAKTEREIPVVILERR